MEAMRKAANVTPFAPIPRVEGHRKRMSATLAALRSLGFRVDMLLLALEHDWIERFDTGVFRAMRDMVGTFHFVRGRHPRPLAGGSYAVDDWWQPEFEDYARWLFRNVSYDLVLTNYVFTSRVLQLARPNSVRILDTHDVFTGRRAMLESRGLRVEFFHTDAANEAEGLRRADLVLAIKEQEEAIFRGWGVHEVVTMPYAEPTGFVAAPPPRAVLGGPPRFGYLASRNQINVRNFLEFVEVAERLRVPGRPPLEIWAYGSICDVLPEDPRRRYLRGGGVAEAADFYAAIDCVIVPQHFSTGLKIKVGEALSYGRPIICHEHTFEGFGGALDEALVCPSFEDMVRCMYRFAEDPAMPGTLTEAVRQMQLRQVGVVERSVHAMGDFARRCRDNLLLLVDGAALRQDKLYRFVVEAVSTAFIGAWRVVLAMPAAEFRRRSEDDLVGAASVCLGYERIEELRSPEGCGYDWSGVFALDRGTESWPALAGPSWGCPRFAAEDVARYLAAIGEAGQGVPPAAAPAEGVWWLRSSGSVTEAMVPSRGDGGAVPVRFLRWSPWFFEVARGDVGYSLSRSVWLLCHADRRPEAAALAEVLAGRLRLPARIYCADLAAPGRPSALPAGDAYREAFGAMACRPACSTCRAVHRSSGCCGSGCS
jgi:hypothetical protein